METRARRNAGEHVQARTSVRIYGQARENTDDRRDVTDYRTKRYTVHLDSGNMCEDIRVLYEQTSQKDLNEYGVL